MIGGRESTGKNIAKQHSLTAKQQQKFEWNKLTGATSFSQICRLVGRPRQPPWGLAYGFLK